jgi:tetratricopeptide (TPR) repeat protein
LNLDFDHIQSQVAFVEIFFVACFYFLILLAYPTQGTAGYEISELLKGNTTAEDIHKVHYNVASYQLTALKRIHDAEEMAEKGYRKYPTDPIILQTYATKLMDVNKLATAFAIIDKIERVSEPDPYKEALLYNNVAWSYLKGNDVQKARDWSEKAMAIVPWAVPFKGTWGAVLVESGDFEEGMKVIREVIAKEIERSHLATLNAHLAIGYARMGQTQLAKTALQDALNYDKDAEFVSKAVAEVDSAKTN